MDPITGNALLSAGSNLLGNVLGFASNKSSNKANLRIAQLNNQFQERMMDKQISYNWDVMKYNSASNQRKRLEEAGLNPYMMLNGGNAGTGQGTGVTAPSGSVPTMQPYQPDFSGVGSAFTARSQQLIDKMLAESQADKTNAEAEGIKIDNRTRDNMNLVMLRKLEEETDNEKLKKFYQGLQLNILEGQKNALIEQPGIQNELWREQKQLTIAQTAYQDLQGMLSAKELSTWDQRFLQEMCVLASQQHANEAAATKAVSEALEAKARTDGIKIDNKIKKDTAYAVVRSARWAATKMRYDAINSSWNAKSSSIRVPVDKGYEKGSIWYRLVQGTNSVGDLIDGILPFKSFLRGK